MIHLTVRIVILAALVAFPQVSTAAPIGFVNGDFETGDLTGWTVGGVFGTVGVATDGTAIAGEGPVFVPAFVDVRTGTWAAYTTVADFADEYLSLSQTVNIAAGAQTVGFYMSNDSNSLFGIFAALNDGALAIFINGVHHAFTVHPPGDIIPIGSYQEFNVAFVSAGGPTLFELRISGSGFDRAGISIDDAYVTGAIAAVPEPTTVLLIGSGLVALARRRRSRRQN